MNENKTQIINLKFAYQEICKSYETQKDSINLLNTKFNWLMVSNIAMLGFIVSSNNLNFKDTINIIFPFISLIISVVSLWSLNYARGPKLDELLNTEDWNSINLIKQTNKKIATNIERNKNKIINLTILLKIDIISIILGIIIIFIKLVWS